MVSRVTDGGEVEVSDVAIKEQQEGSLLGVGIILYLDCGAGYKYTYISHKMTQNHTHTMYHYEIPGFDIGP